MISCGEVYLSAPISYRLLRRANIGVAISNPEKNNQPKSSVFPRCPPFSPQNYARQTLPGVQCGHFRVGSGADRGITGNKILQVFFVLYLPFQPSGTKPSVKSYWTQKRARTPRIICRLSCTCRPMVRIVTARGQVESYSHSFCVRVLSSAVCITKVPLQ